MERTKSASLRWNGSYPTPSSVEKITHERWRGWMNAKLSMALTLVVDTCADSLNNPRVIPILDRTFLTLPVKDVETSPETLRELYGLRSRCCYSGWGFERYTKGCWDASLDGFGLVNDKCFIE